MLQFLSLFIEPLHIICFYILFCTQNWQYIREVRSNKFIKLAISVIALVVIQVVIELGLIPIPWLFFLCTNVVTILFLIVITYLCLRRHAIFRQHSVNIDHLLLLAVGDPEVDKFLTGQFGDVRVVI